MQNKIKCYHTKLFHHKYLEIQIGRFDNHGFNFQFEFSTKRDHAGLLWYNEILGYHFIITIYDNRHWDTVNSCWEK